MRRFLNIWILLLISVLTWAQATRVPFMCGFEEKEDLSNWVFNINTPTAMDRWTIGSVTRSEGKRSLYISTDGGADYTYGNRPNVVVSYLRFKFPTATKQENYDISFDWKCEGEANQSMLYVMICPEQAFLTKTQGMEGYYIGDIASATNGTITNATKDVCSKLGPNRVSFLSGSNTWQNISLSQDLRISSANSRRNWVIAFIWVNSNRDPKNIHGGACIDNFQIAKATIKKPDNVQVEASCVDSTLRVTWESASSYFLVDYKAVGTTTWRRLDGITAGSQYFERDGVNCSYEIKRIKEGSYDVRVQSFLNNDTSAYVTANNILMFCPDNHCINYMDLDNPNLLCTYGWVEGKGPGNTGTPYTNIGYIYDPNDRKLSRHTIMTDPDEKDPMTDSILSCIPKGKVGSVRLGNWNTTYEAESMTYTFAVDSFDAAILLIQYACVLNKPNENCGDPGFRMEVFDENGNPIEDLCGVPDFTYSSAAASGWNENKKGDVVWKDWTDVGINLLQYSGQTLKVRFTTRDCGGGGHFGYAYFTLECASAYIETENCGNDAKIVCNAPDGFNYLWFDENGTEISRDQTLIVDAGQHTYTCRVSFIDDPTCYFEVSTMSAPRFPVPAFEYQIRPGECSNRVFFTNKSHIMHKYYGYEYHTNEACEDQLWTFTKFSDGTTTQTSNYGPMYVAPIEGDTILVRLTTYIGENNACDSTLDSIIIVPRIIDRDSTEYMVRCQGDPFFFNGQWYSAEKDDTLEVTSANFAGCDSTYTLYLKVNPTTPEEFRKDSICSDSLIVIGDSVFTKEGHYTVFMQNQYGCDSIITTDIWVNQRLDMNLDHEGRFIVCADNGTLDIDYTIMLGQFDTARIVFSQEAKAVGFTDLYITDPTLTTLSIPYAPTTLPGHYTAVVEFIQSCCKPTRYNIDFDVNYASAVVEQKWNDVLTVLSPKYNGGYSFIAFQWYKNGKPISGATSSYLYEPLDTTAYYHVVLTREDSVAVATCPVTPVLRTEKTKFPTLVQTSQQIPAKLQSKSQIRFVTATGMNYYRATFEAGDIVVTAPAVPGVYVVEIAPLDGERTAQQLIVQ